MKSLKTGKTNSLAGNVSPAEHSESNQIDLDSIVLSDSTNFQHRLWSAEKQLVPLPVEVAFLFSVDGIELGRAIGTAKRIVLTEEQCELVRGGILTHNHPDGSFFSSADVLTAHKLNLTELRAVRRNNPIKVLSMCRPAKGWCSAEDFEALIKKEEKANIEEVLRNLAVGGLNAMSFSDNDLKGIVDIKWPAFFQARLHHLGYSYKSMLLQEPPK